MLKTLTATLFTSFALISACLAGDTSVKVEGDNNRIVVVPGGVYVNDVFYPTAAQFEAAPFCVTPIGNFPTTADKPYHVSCKVNLMFGSVEGWTGELWDSYYLSNH